MTKRRNLNVSETKEFLNGLTKEQLVELALQNAIRTAVIEDELHEYGAINRTTYKAVKKTAFKIAVKA